MLEIKTVTNGPLRSTFSEFATTPCRGLSLSMHGGCGARLHASHAIG